MLSRCINESEKPCCQVSKPSLHDRDSHQAHGNLVACALHQQPARVRLFGRTYWHVSQLHLLIRQASIVEALLFSPKRSECAHRPVMNLPARIPDEGPLHDAALAVALLRRTSILRFLDLGDHAFEGFADVLGISRARLYESAAELVRQLFAVCCCDLPLFGPQVGFVAYEHDWNFICALEPELAAGCAYPRAVAHLVRSWSTHTR